MALSEFNIIDHFISLRALSHQASGTLHWLSSYYLLLLSLIFDSSFWIWSSRGPWDLPLGIPYYYLTTVYSLHCNADPFCELIHFTILSFHIYNSTMKLCSDLINISTWMSGKHLTVFSTVHMFICSHHIVWFSTMRYEWKWSLQALHS